MQNRQDAELNFSGHSPRAGGAQSFARFGVDAATIGLMARHSGATILWYVRHAPFAGLRGVAAAVESRQASPAQVAAWAAL